MIVRAPISTIVMTVALASAASSIQASYYVLPYSQLEAQLYDPISGTFTPQPGYQVANGLEADGATFNHTLLDDGLRHAFASVDLANGELKVEAGASGGTRRASANAIFGDTVTITGGAGTYWDFTLELDGFFGIEFGERDEGAPPTLGNASYDITLAIYRPGVTTMNTWATTDVGQAVFYDSINDFTTSFDRDTSEIWISHWIGSNILLESNTETFEIYARIMAGVGTSTYDGITNIVGDFSHTARLSFGFEPGATAYSASGALLGLGMAPAVPEPETYALMLAGLGLVGWAAARRRKVGV